MDLKIASFLKKILIKYKWNVNIFIIYEFHEQKQDVEMLVVWSLIDLKGNKDRLFLLRLCTFFS